MKPSILFLMQFVLHFIPETRGFGLKRILYRMAGANIEENVRICSSVKVFGNGNFKIGKNTWVGHGSVIMCSSSIDIGSNVDIGPEVFIGTGTHVIDTDSENVAGRGISKDVIIGNGSWLCARSIILPGVTVGNKAIIASGAVVLYNVLGKTVVGGVPAKMIKNL